MTDDETIPKDLPTDIWLTACDVAHEVFDANCDLMELGDSPANPALMIANAIRAERDRWKPASVYFDRYCQDEADDVENCVCGLQQHEDAKAFAAVATPLLR